MANNTRDTEVLTSFGKHLRNLRNEKGFSQEELARLAEVDKNQIGNLERGEKNPTLTTLRVIAGALGVTVGELTDF